jgi:hypothetical protein
VIQDVQASVLFLYPDGCSNSVSIISAIVTDVDDPPARLTATFSYSGRINGQVNMTYNAKTGRFEGALGPFKQLLNSTLSITVSASDDDGNLAKPVAGPTITTNSQCQIG